MTAAVIDPAVDPLAWALAELDPASDRMRLYALYDDYYSGNHRMAFATEQYETEFWRVFRGLSDNLCASVVDVQVERLEVSGFTTSEARTVGGGVLRSVEDALGTRAWEAWEDSDLDLVADEVHRDALLYGDGFAILWDEGQGVGVWPQAPYEMAVHYSAGKRGEMDAAAKAWLADDGHVRLNVYLPGQILRFMSREKAQREVGINYKPTEFAEVATDRNPRGLVPVVHWANRAFGQYGISELSPVVPLQDALNKTLCDMLVTMEFQAFQQRWVTGVDIPVDPLTGKPKEKPFAAGADRILSVPDENAQFGAFPQSDMAPFLGAQRELRSEIARVSGIPLHYFFVNTAEAPTGESLKTMELRFSRKLRNRQRLFGKTWENAMTMLLELLNVSLPDDLDINTVWSAETPRSDSELLDVQLKKKEVGVPLSQLQLELGYDREQITQFATEADRTPPNTDSPEDIERRRRLDDSVPPQQRG